MALTPRTETYGDTAAATSLACNVPASAANGDLLFMWIGLNNASSFVVNGGVSAWSLLGSYTTNADKYYLYARVAASEPASYTPTFSGSTKARIVMSCYIASSDFISAIPTLVSNTAYRTSNTTVQAAQLVTIKANQCLILFAGAYYTTAVKTFTKPSTQGGFWVENDDAGNTNSDFALEICSGIWSGPGATGVINSTMSSGNIATKHGFAVALPTNVPITPTVGGVTAAGVAGILGLALLASVGATSLAGYSPTIQIDAPETNITPSVGSFVVTGYEVRSGIAVTPPSMVASI
jgi:hypothetical protein